jgi:hypothetical protein
VSSGAWKPWIVLLGVVAGTVGLNTLAIHGGGYVDGWPIYTIVGGLVGGIFTRIIVGPVGIHE